MNSVKHHLYMRRHKIGGYLPPLISSEADADAFVYQHKIAVATNPAKAVQDGMDQVELYEVGTVELLTGKIEVHDPVCIADLGGFVPRDLEGGK